MKKHLPTEDEIRERFGEKFLLDKTKSEFFAWGFMAGTLFTWLVGMIIFLTSCKVPSITTEKPKYGIEIKCDTVGCAKRIQ